MIFLIDRVLYWMLVKSIPHRKCWSDTGLKVSMARIKGKRVVTLTWMSSRGKDCKTELTGYSAFELWRFMSGHFRRMWEEATFEEVAESAQAVDPGCTIDWTARKITSAASSRRK